MPTANKTLVFGHRGASQDAPENTLVAFREAFRQGADGIEGDFHLTADGQIVCIHDESALRTGGKPLVVADCSLRELRSLEYGSWKAPQFHGEPLPALADLPPILPVGRWLVLELKTGPEIVAPLVDFLQTNREIYGNLLVIAFDERVISEFKRRMPGVLAHWLTDYQWSAEEKSWKPSVESVIETIQRCGADGLGSENRPDIIDESFIKSLRSAGIDQFHVWTVDSPDEAVYYRRLGAFAVTTNCPGKIRLALTQ